MNQGGDKATGFTLIEVLVALVVVSLILTIVMSAALSARDRQHRAELREEAVVLAAALVADQTIRPAASSASRGTQGRLRWELEERELARDPAGFFALEHIEARLFDRQDKLVYRVATRAFKDLPLR